MRPGFSFLSKICIFLVAFALFSCLKEEETIHKDVVVNGNQAPPYSGIPSILIRNYVNKLNIDLVGLEASSVEVEEDVLYLKDNALSEQSRLDVINDILELDAFHDRLFQVSSDLMLNGMGYDEIEAVHDEYSFVRDFYLQVGDTFTAQFFDNELNKVQLVLDAPGDYKAGNISLNEYYSRFSYNLIYDEINMGSENFVISCFENLFKRYPTADELEKGVRMVDGQPSTLLLKEGRTKTDFLRIVTEDPEFYQGRVLDAYRSFLLRDPLSDELTKISDEFIQSDEYFDVLRAVTKTDEYAGFE